MKNKSLILILAILGYLIYFISPIDLIPDFTGLFGKLDDFALLGYLIWLFRKYGRKNAFQSAHQETFTEPEWLHSDDPYQILGISKETTQEEVKLAYKKLAAQYHPDKVNHLGKEFQELANKKYLKIKWAYDQLIQE